MPTLIEEPELQFTRRLFEGAKPAGSNPQAQLGGWMVWQGFLQTFEQTLIWPADNVAPAVMQTYRAFVTTVLGMGEHLLTFSLPAPDKEAVEATVRFLRDKLAIEFSEANPFQGESLLMSVFGEEVVASQGI